MSRRKICIVTGTRAEYGLFYPLILELSKVERFQVQIIVTGMHLSPEFGLTYREIERDGFTIDEKVEMLLSSDSEVGVSKSIGLGIIGFADAYQRLKPDLVVLLGDRFETFAAAIAAMVARIPVAHLYGGELTVGNIDDNIRHSITKMAHMHFTSTERYRQRVIQLGESPEHVFNVGALGIDNIKKLNLLSKNDFEKKVSFTLGELSALVTFHPATLEENTAGYQFDQLIEALNRFKDLKTIFTKPNADTGGRVVAGKIDEYVQQNSGKAVAFTSMGQPLYLSALKNVSVVIGNSSSGIIEAPSFGIPTVNIGDRQRGRIMADSVINCAPNADEICCAVNKALSPEFRAFCRNVKNPNGSGFASEQIVRLLLQHDTIHLKKIFYDIV